MQDKHYANKSKPKNEKEKEKEANLNNIYKSNLNINNNNNLITKKSSNESEKNNKISKKNLELDNKNNLIYKTTYTKNNQNDNLGLLKENNNLNINLNNNFKKSKSNINNLESEHQKKTYNNENENRKKKQNNQEGIQNEEEQIPKENNDVYLNISNEEKHNNHNHIQKTETSIYSYVNRSTQLDYFQDLLNFIKSEKTKSNRIMSTTKNKNGSSLNINNDRKNKNNNKIAFAIIERFKFNFDVTIRLTLNKFYNLYPAEFNKIVVENLIFNKNCHLVSVFKDHMIFDYIDEFLKRFYFNEESKERIPKISNYYKNYLKFFCNPIFRDFKINNIIQGYGDYKAEMYYNRNYGTKANNNNNGNENNDNNNNFNPSRKRPNQENSQLKKIFDTNAKINIERNSIMSCSNMSIKQQIFNESNFQYYIDKIQINKMKGGNDFMQQVNQFEEGRDLIDKRNSNFLKNQNDSNNLNNSKFTNTLLEFSHYNLNNYCFTNNNFNDDSSRLNTNNNAEDSNLVIDNFKDENISSIMQYKDLQKIIDEQSKNFEKENKQILNKNIHSGLNGIINSEKEIIKANKDINNNIIKNNLEKIFKNNSIYKRNHNSNFNENESKTMLRKSTKNVLKDENFYTNRSNEESILSLINIIDLKNNENILQNQKQKNNKKGNYDDVNFIKAEATQSQMTMRKSNKNDEADENKNESNNYKTRTSKVNSQASNNDFLKNNEKKTIKQLESNSSSINKNIKNNNNNYNILSKGLNNDNPYIIKKRDFKENRNSIGNNSVLNKLNFKNIDSNSNSKSKSNSKTFTDPNNNSNNAYLGLNTSKTLTNHNKSNYTNNSALNIKNGNQEEEKSILKPSENQGKSIFKPKINSVEIIKSNFNSNKNFSSNSNQEKNQYNKHEFENDYYPSGVENHKKNSSKLIEKSNVHHIDRAPTINLLKNNSSKIDVTLHLINNKNFEHLAYKTQDKKQILVDKMIKIDGKNNYYSKKDSGSNSNSKDKVFEKKLFSTLDSSNFLLNSQSKFNLLSPSDNKNNEIINSKLSTKNIIIYNNNNKSSTKNSEVLINANNNNNNKFSPSNKNGINSFKANNNIINYNLYNKTLNHNTFEGKKVNLDTNKNSDETTNMHTKSAELRANNNLKNPCTKTTEIEAVNMNQAHDQSKNKLLYVNQPQITLNYKINSRNHNQNNQVIKITNSNSNNMATGNDQTNSNVNFNKSENNNSNKYVIINNNSNLKNSQNHKFSTTKNPINLANVVKEGNSTNNFFINSSVYNSNLNMTDKIKKAINSYSKNKPGNNDKTQASSETKQLQNNYVNNNREFKKPNDFNQKIIKKPSISASNKAFNNPNYNNNNNQNNNKVQQHKSENSNSHHMELISDETLENLSPNAINEIKNNILLNNPNLMSKTNALTDIMKITLSFYMDKSNSRNNRPTSNTSAHKTANNILNNQLGSINLLNDNLKKTTIINQIENLNKFNININNQFNLGNLNSINPNQLLQINNIANMNPGIFINNSSENSNSIGNMNNNNNNNKNGILEYNAKKKSQSKSITNKTNENNNVNNQLNQNSNNLSSNISSTTHNGMLKFNEKTQISEITNYGFPPNENKNYKNISDNYHFKNQESSCLSTHNKFNKSSNLDNAYFNLEKKGQISIDKLQNINNNILNKHDVNTNSNNPNNDNNNNNASSKLKLTFSQDINSLKNIIEKNKVLSRNKNANLFKISSNQNMTKPGIISEEDNSNNKDLNAKTNYNNNNYSNTIFNLNSANKNSSVFFNASKIKNSFSEKSDMNLLKENHIQIKAFNSYAHKEKEQTSTNNQKKPITNKSPNSNTAEGNQLAYLKKTIDEKNIKLAITKLKLPSPSTKISHLTNDIDSGHKLKINLNSNKKQTTDSFIQRDFNSTKENINSKINFNTNLKNLKISFENKNISAGESNNNNNNNNNNNKINNLNNLNANMINLNNNPSYNSLIKSKDLQIDHRTNILSNKNSKKIVFIKK